MVPRRATLGAGRKYGFRAPTFVQGISQGISRPDAARAYAPTRGDGLARLWGAPRTLRRVTGVQLERAATLDVHRHDPSRADADPRGVERHARPDAHADRFAAVGVGFGPTTDLHEARRPRVHGGGVVGDERHVGAAPASRNFLLAAMSLPA